MLFGRATRQMALGAVIATTVACSSGGICAQRNGAYRVTWSLRDGNCGPVPEGIVVIDKQPTAASLGCGGSISYSADNCKVTVNTTACPGTNGSTFDQRGTATWSSDGSSGNATIQLVIHQNGAVTCSGTYDLNYQRQ